MQKISSQNLESLIRFFIDCVGCARATLYLKETIIYLYYCRDIHAKYGIIRFQNSKDLVVQTDRQTNKNPFRTLF